MCVCFFLRGSVCFSSFSFSSFRCWFHILLSFFNHSCNQAPALRGQYRYTDLQREQSRRWSRNSGREWWRQTTAVCVRITHTHALLARRAILWIYVARMTQARAEREERRIREGRPSDVSCVGWLVSLRVCFRALHTTFMISAE